MHIEFHELSLEISEIKHLMTLLSDLFSIRTAFIYNIADEEYTREIAGNNGDYQEYCKLIQEELGNRCKECDKDKFKEASKKNEPLLYRCYNGLYEMFLPLYIEKVIAGYLHFGQVRSDDDFDLIADQCSLHLHSRTEELRKLYNNMIVFKKEKLLQISRLFQMISEIMLKNRFIEIMKANPEFYLKKYVEDHLSESLTVKSAAEYLNRSPSFITHSFKKVQGCSFHDYLTKSRIDRAKNLLLTKSIEETFPECGFKNRYHFSKVFRRAAGITPGEYKRSNHKT